MRIACSFRCKKSFLMCNGIVFQCFGAFFEWFWGVSSEMGQSCGTKLIFKFRASSTLFNSEIHCLHGLEQLISNDVTRVEIPPLYANLHHLIHESQTVVKSAKLMNIHYKITIVTIQVLSIELTDQSNKLFIKPY